MITDTKRLRELAVAQHMLDYHTRDELRSLILAACDELEDLQSRYDRRINAHDKDGRALMRIAAERNAIRAKFSELRGDVSRLRGITGDERVNAILDRFPALDSSEGA